MAAMQPAVGRILYLLGQGPYRSSPSTLNGSNIAIRSYGLPILFSFGAVDPFDNMCVTNQRSTVTTNRHINAAHAAMRQLGYVKVQDVALGTWYQKPAV